VAAVQRAGVPAVVLHGGMDLADRRRVQQRFNDGGVSLLATDAAAEGLNLHRHCRVVLHYELPWSAARLEQRAGRVDRLGQRRRVHEIALIAAGTAERLVLAPLAARAARARQRGDDTSGLLAALTEERVAELVMIGGPLDLPRSWRREQQPPAARPIDLRDEAIAEVHRIATHRVFGQQSPALRQRPTHVAVARLRRRTRASSVMLRFRLSITDRRGGLVHVDDLVVSVDMPDAVLRGSNPRIRHVVAALAESRAVRDCVWSCAKAVAAQVLDAVRLAEGEIVRRRQRISLVRGSTARALVQANLFVRSPSGRAPDRALPLDERQEDGADGEPSALTPRIELVAALIGVR